jgi:hypothetical protein
VDDDDRRGGRASGCGYRIHPAHQYDTRFEGQPPSEPRTDNADRQARRRSKRRRARASRPDQIPRAFEQLTERSLAAVHG